MPAVRLPFALSALLVAIAAVLVFLPGLPGAFVFDDIPNIIENLGVKVDVLQWQTLADAAFNSQAGGITRVIPMLSFALDYYRGHGFDPATFKTTNIAIHALTTLVLAFFLRSLLLLSGTSATRARWLAPILALVWAVHPVQVSSVLYIVQRMQTLSTLFVVLALWSYLRARASQIAGNPGRTGWLVTGLLWMLGLACKEDAMLLPLYMLSIELTVLRFRAADPQLARRMRKGYMLATAAGFAVFLLFVIPHFWSSGPYHQRNFSSVERILTEARVLCLYLSQLLLPLPSRMPFYYDWLQPSRGLLHPWTTLPAILLLAALLALAWRLRTRRPLFALGIFLFFAGHFMTSNVLGLELAFEHRNHFPLIGIVLAAADLVIVASTRWRISTPAITATAMVVIALMGSATVARARAWSNPVIFAETSTRLAPLSPRAWNEVCTSWFNLGGGMRKGNPYLDKAIPACMKAAEVAPNSLVGPTNFVLFKSLQGSMTPVDWERYLAEVRRVPMTPKNASSLWVVLNGVREGVALGDERVFEIIRIHEVRHGFKVVESAALGYFILEHTGHPAEAEKYFIAAIDATPDPQFASSIADDLRKDGYPDLANRLLMRADAALP